MYILKAPTSSRILEFPGARGTFIVSQILVGLKTMVIPHSVAVLQLTRPSLNSSCWSITLFVSLLNLAGWNPDHPM